MTASSAYLERNPSRDVSVRQLLEQDIGLDSLEEALEFVTVGEDDTATDVQPSRLCQMLQMMRDPALGCARDGNGHFRNSITKIMKECGLKAPDILDVVRKRDLALAILNSGKHIYRVLDDVGEDAKSRVVLCQRCDGSGDEPIKNSSVGDPDIGEPSIPALSPCKQCDGVGRIRKIGDAESRKLLLEVHGLRKGAGGNSTTLNVGVGVGVSVKGEKADGQQESVTTRVQRILDMDLSK